VTTLAQLLYHIRSRYPESEELYRTALAVERRQLGPESRFTTRSEEGLANLLMEEYRFDEAEVLLREVLRVRLKLLGPDSTDTLLTQRNLACLLLAEGHLGDAERLFRETLERDQQVLAPNDRDLFGVKYMLAQTLLAAHRPQEAEVLARQAFDGQLQALGPQHPETLNGLNRLGRALAALGRYDEANALYTSLLGRIAAVPGADSSKGWYAYGVMAAQSGHADDAFDHLEHAVTLGYKDVETLRNEEELRSLRGDARFAKLIERMQVAAQSSTTPLKF
jgi:tetratricopeptide (TPR) repeat protein